jgi:ABC-type transport system involved in Fe-S cluster assembly fused permease/ATPase subunit
MNDSWFDNYARITPYVLVVVGILAYLYAGGIWWGVPIIGIAVLLYAFLKVRVTKWSKTRVDRRIGRKR